MKVISLGVDWRPGAGRTSVGNDNWLCNIRAVGRPPSSLSLY